MRRQTPLAFKGQTRPVRFANAARLRCIAIASGLAFSVAWLVTETIASAVLGWVAAALAHLQRSRTTGLPAGVLLRAGRLCRGFYWIYGTVARFGGYGPIVSGVIFALYVASGALFFLVFAWTHHNLGPMFDAFALRSPTAIVVAELITIRLFYWHFGHTQVAFTPFVQIAGIGGAHARVVRHVLGGRGRRSDSRLSRMAPGLSAARGRASRSHSAMARS